MLNRLQDTGTPVAVQDTTLSLDVLGRFICNTWDEAVNNGGVQFDAVVIGSGMFGAYCAEKIFRHANLRVLVLEAGPILVSEHVQNLARIGLNVGNTTAVPNNGSDPGTQALVWGIPWRSQVGFPGLAYCVGGRSLYWGGWSPRLTKADLDRATARGERLTHNQGRHRGRCSSSATRLDRSPHAISSGFRAARGASVIMSVT
jgi:choline dehydrogenase-like flavoprotein